MAVTPPKPKFFAKAADFRKWLKTNHARETELWVGFYKVGTGKPTISYKEAVDEALCFGWIDGVRKSIDEESYTNRFTPRKTSSNWSQINIRRVKELTEQGRMHAAGLKAFNERDKRKTNQYSFEREQLEFSPEHLALFKKHKPAWTFFQAQPPGYRKLMTWYVVSAKREATRSRRLGYLIEESGQQRRVQSMPSSKKTRD
jgi:uncharacterized protein YdeI (YjbR/CyaY-like superfamily)